MYTSLLLASLVCLTTSLSNGHRIVQPYRVDSTDGQATVECLYAKPPRPQPQELHITLLKGLHDDKEVCSGYINSTFRSMRTQKPNVCQVTLTESGISVSVEGLRGEDTDLYRCLVKVIYPPPYLKWYGNGTLVHILGERENAMLSGKIPALSTTIRGPANSSGSGDRALTDPGREAGSGSAMGGGPIPSAAGSGGSDSDRHHLSDGRD